MLGDQAQETGAAKSGEDAAALPRWKCVCAYDGAAFNGWQSQEGGGAIQDVIEARLKVLFGRLTRIHGSGRTDAGVHARGQVFHFDAEWRHGPEKLRLALRSGLPAAIQLISIRRVSASFHSRFSATGKVYAYHLHLGEADPFTRPYVWMIEKNLNLPLMREAAALLQGRHDFRAFTALNGPPKEDTVRDLRRLEVAAKGRRIRITAEADGFMYKMVRSLVGALVTVADGRLSLAELRRLLETGTRTAIVQTAPPQGLFLEKVLYR